VKAAVTTRQIRAPVPSRRDVAPAWASGHIPVLDGLRGVAILLVFFHHAIAVALEPTTTIDFAVRRFAQVGWTGVDLFFVLSGFLITGVLLDTKGEPRWWPRFIARRGLRIFPLYYGALVLLFVLLPRLVEWSPPAYATLRANQVWYWTYTVNLLHGFTRGQGTPLNTEHFWSLAIEEQFYLIWPLVVWRCQSRTLLRVVALATLAGFAFRLALVLYAPADAGMTYVFTPGRLDGLMVGAGLAVVARSPGSLAPLAPWARRALWGGVAALAALAVLRGSFNWWDPVIAVMALPLIALVYGALLVRSLTAGPASRLSRVLSRPWLRSWGKYSYCLYVIHFPLMGLLAWKFSFYEHGVEALGGSRLPAVLVFIGIATAVSYGLAWLSYHVYERPFLELKRYFDSPAPSRAQVEAR
jgi:peptidoglycan/LPS O-acetylase OafA/YrhL